jgi:hypothetical protein
MMPKSFPKLGIESNQKRKMFVQWKALFVNISGPFCMPFNSDFRVTEIPELLST